MSTARRFVRNVLSLTVSRPISKVVAFLASVWLVRYLGDAKLGILATALGFVGLFGYISDFGTQHFVTREVSRDRGTAGAYLNNFLSVQVLFAVFLFSLIVLLVNVLGYDVQVRWAVYLAGAGLVITSMSAPFKAIFHAHEAIHISALLGVVLALAEGCLTIGGIVLGRGIRFFASISIFSGLAVVVMSYFLCKGRFAHPRFGWDMGLWWGMLKMSFPFALLMSATVIYKRIDIQMLYAMKGKVAVGYYSAVERFVRPLGTVAQDIMAAMYPILSRKYVGSEERFRFAAEKTLKYVAALAIPMAVGAFLLSDKIVLLLYREAFRASIPALRILCWTLAVSSLTLVIAYSVVAAGRVLTLAAFNGLAALANVTLNLLLIPRYSFSGAALATVVCEAALLAAFVGYMHRSKVARFPWVDVGKIAIAAIVMGVFVWLCRSASIFVTVPAGAVVYCAVLLAMRFLKREEVDFVKSVFQRK